MLVPERGDPTTKIGLFVGTEVRFIIFKIRMKSYVDRTQGEKKLLELSLNS